MLNAFSGAQKMILHLCRDGNAMDEQSGPLSIEFSYELNDAHVEGSGRRGTDSSDNSNRFHFISPVL